MLCDFVRMCQLSTNSHIHGSLQGRSLTDTGGSQYFMSSCNEHMFSLIIIELNHVGCCSSFDVMPIKCEYSGVFR